MRLIDADELEKKLQEQREIYINLDTPAAEHLLVHDFLRYVWEAPTIDAVPKTQCLDCQFSGKYSGIDLRKVNATD